MAGFWLYVQALSIPVLAVVLAAVYYWWRWRNEE